MICDWQGCPDAAVVFGIRPSGQSVGGFCEDHIPWEDAEYCPHCEGRVDGLFEHSPDCIEDAEARNAGGRPE